MIAPAKEDHLAAKRALVRERILDSAIESFLESRSSQASTADIARRAQVSKREVYLHFGDKRTLFYAAITKVQAEVSLDAIADRRASSTLKALLEDAGTSILRQMLSPRFRTLFQVVAAEAMEDPELGRQFYLFGPERGVKELSQLIREQIAKGRIRKVNSRLVARQFMNLVIGESFFAAVALGIEVGSLRSYRTQIRQAVEAIVALYSPAESESSGDIDPR